MQLIQQIKSFIQNHKILSILIVILLITTYFKVTIKKSPEIIQAPLSSATPIPNSLETQSPTKLYLLNSIETQSPVTGYSWAGNILVYSTPTGIFRADSNMQLIALDINSIAWNRTGSAIYHSDNKWSLFIGTSSTEIPINQSASGSIILSDSSQTALSADNTQLTTIDLLTNQLTTKSFPNNIVSSFILNDLSFVIQTSDQKVYALNQDLVSREVHSLSPGDELIAAGKNGELVTRNKSILKIITNTSYVEIPFRENSIIEANFTGNNEILVIEYLRDKLGRRTEHFWRVKNLRSKEYLTNSLPIPWKLEFNQPIIPNNTLQVVPLIDRNQQLWLLPLVSRGLPVYSSQGLSFIKIKDGAANGI